MTLRQEAHAYIDDISENKLEALRPLLSVLAEESVIIETDLTEEEQELIAEGMAEYAKNPESFVSLESIK
jgi:hypothetical protein